MRARELLRDSRGFTLIELLVVVTIIAVLSLMLKAAVEGYITKGRIARCQAELAAMRQEVQMYYVNNETYPTIQDIAGVMQAAGIKWNPNDPNGLKDPWKQPYEYYVDISGTVLQGRKYVIESKGPDKIWGTRDDIVADFFGVTVGPAPRPGGGWSASSK